MCNVTDVSTYPWFAMTHMLTFMFVIVLVSVCSFLICTNVNNLLQETKSREEQSGSIKPLLKYQDAVCVDFSLSIKSTCFVIGVVHWSQLSEPITVLLMHIWSVASVFLGFSIHDSFPWNVLILEHFAALLQSLSEGNQLGFNVKKNHRGIWKFIDPNKCV